MMNRRRLIFVRNEIERQTRPFAGQEARRATRSQWIRLMSLTSLKNSVAAAALLALAPLGCASMSDKTANKDTSLLDRMPWAAEKDEAPEPYPNPVKIAATWTPDSLIQTGRTPTRGFGGRVFFYDEKSRPVPVEGTLIVHGFDDRAETAAGRVKRFEFTPEQFTRHFSQSDLGASYSVWIPWDAVGGEQRQISLVASFKTIEGKAVQGIPATVVLPGRTETDADLDPLAKYSPQYRKYLDAQHGVATRTTGLTTTTIQRRRGRTNLHPKSVPGITIPRIGTDSMMANRSPTPSVDIEMSAPNRSMSVQPASAQMPINR
jgi:hypothetical protein